MGSKGSAGLARIANSTIEWNVSGSRASFESISRTSSPTQRSATDIWLSVRVPVLSTHRAVVAPSVSTAGIRRVRTWCLGEPPCAEGEEDGQHHRKLLGKHRHPECKAGEKSFQPISACQPEDKHYR